MLYQTKELYTRYKEQNCVYKIQDSRNILNNVNCGDVLNCVNCGNCQTILNDLNVLKCIFMSFRNCLKILENQKTNKCSRTNVCEQAFSNMCSRVQKKFYARAGKFRGYIVCTREEFPGVSMREKKFPHIITKKHLTLYINITFVLSAI